MLQPLLKIVLTPAITAFARWWISTPSRNKVHASLDTLYREIKEGKREMTRIIDVNLDACKLVIVSDQHKGIRNKADDFRFSANNYCRALEFYYQKGFTLINNGDAEELWENKPEKVIEKNTEPLELEARFLKAGRYYRLWGNHDLEWKVPQQRSRFLENAMGLPLPVYEALFLKTTYRSFSWTFLITHGHQGDHTSDGNRFSTWFVARIWTPIQRYLGIHLDTTASSFALVDRHNRIMYEWTRTHPQLLLITGHTHKPVFASLDHIDRLNKQLVRAKKDNDHQRALELEKEINRRKKEYKGKGLLQEKQRPSYFNSGCCCYADGDMTCLEWEDGMIRLVKWKQIGEESLRQVLEESPVNSLLDELLLASKEHPLK